MCICLAVSLTLSLLGESFFSEFCLDGVTLFDDVTIVTLFLLCCWKEKRNNKVLLSLNFKQTIQNSGDGFPKKFRQRVD